LRKLNKLDQSIFNEKIFQYTHGYHVEV